MTHGRSAQVQELWRELGASMRLLRINAGRSLRDVEASAGYGRGVLSQVENAKARPARGLVEWYDDAFAGDGLLLALYAEARTAPPSPSIGRAPAVHGVPGDAMTTVTATLPFGEQCFPGSTIRAGWLLANTGSVAWRGRSLRRVGAVAGERMIASPTTVSVPDTEPGGTTQVEIELRIPPTAGTYAAYWEMTDQRGRRCFGREHLLNVLLVGGW